jgi:anaerobic dimethyl sulfoxide reductase subunit B (iron-sulfur subunit)
MQALSGACNHCDNAWCMKVCPTRAISRREQDGTVQIDITRCIGCRLCEEFCPHHAPQFNRVTGKMEKCTGCYDRIELGMQPACSTLCPTGALQWGKWSDIQGKGSPNWPGLPGGYTDPRIRYIVEDYPGR